MYVLKKIVGIKNGLNKKWETINDEDFTVAELFQKFRTRQVELMLENSTDALYLDLDKIADKWSTYTGHFSDLLVLLDITALPTTTIGKKFNHQTCTFRDALSVGYGIVSVNNLNVYDPAALAGEAQNIRLFRRDTNIDYSYMLKRCLISVNGFYHLCDTNGRDGLMVIKAMDGQTLSGQLEIGLLSFSKVCQINCLPIQTDQIVENDQGRVSVDLKTDLTNKSVFMVFAGYMVFLDDLSFKQTGESKFTIDLNNMGLVNRYFEASKFIDLSAINTLKDAARPGRVDVASLTSIDNATAWMTLSQTFFVVCDTPQIYTQKNYLSTSSTVGIYYSYVQPTFPLCLETYRQPSYISFEEGNQWKIIVQDNIVENKLYDSINQAIWQNSDDPLYSGKPYRISRAHLLEIGKDIDA